MRFDHSTIDKLFNIYIEAGVETNEVKFILPRKEGEVKVHNYLKHFCSEDFREQVSRAKSIYIIEDKENLFLKVGSDTIPFDDLKTAYQFYALFYYDLYYQQSCVSIQYFLEHIGDAGLIQPYIRDASVQTETFQILASMFHPTLVETLLEHQTERLEATAERDQYLPEHQASGGGGGAEVSPDGGVVAQYVLDANGYPNNPAAYARLHRNESSASTTSRPEQTEEVMPPFSASAHAPESHTADGAAAVASRELMGRASLKGSSTEQAASVTPEEEIDWRPAQEAIVLLFAEEPVNSELVQQNIAMTMSTLPEDSPLQILLQQSLLHAYAGNFREALRILHEIVPIREDAGSEHAPPFSASSTPAGLGTTPPMPEKHTADSSRHVPEFSSTFVGGGAAALTKEGDDAVASREVGGQIKFFDHSS